MAFVIGSAFLASNMFPTIGMKGHPGICEIKKDYDNKDQVLSYSKRIFVGNIMRDHSGIQACVPESLLSNI